MRLLVTGGLGFIGSNFILQTLKKFPDYNIVNLDDQLEGSNVKSLLEVQTSKNYTFVKGNITDKSLLEKLIVNCDQIINFAAESHVDRSIANLHQRLQLNY